LNNFLEGPRQPKLHLGYLDSLRALAAIYVVINHALLHFQIPVNSFTYRLTYSLRHGHNAVDLFIVLSGFCLMLPVVRNNGLLREGTWQFFKKRARRILPPYYLAMLLSLLLIFTLVGRKTGTLWDMSLPVSNRDIIYHILMIQDIFEDTASTINHAFWSISVEWRIYFLFPLLIYLWRKWGPIQVTLIAVVLSLAIWFALLPTNLNMTPWGINPQYLGLFTLGMLAAQVAFSREHPMVVLRSNIGWKTFFILTGINMLLIGFGHVLMQKGLIGNYTGLMDVAVGLYIAWFLVMLAKGKLALIHRLLSWQPLVFTGTFAYSIYLMHAPLLQLIWQYVLPPLHLGLVPAVYFLILAGTSLIIGISYLFFLVAEQPFIRKRKSPEPALAKSILSK
jgi:peptidoglycan/LPS O-acetylase OafA/YrhL